MDAPRGKLPEALPGVADEDSDGLRVCRINDRGQRERRAAMSQPRAPGGRATILVEYIGKGSRPPRTGLVTSVWRPAVVAA